MRLILSILLLVFSSFLFGQQDTVYLKFTQSELSYYMRGSKHKDDPDPRNYYPFDGGGHYYFKKKPYRTKIDEFTFSFWTYTPEWMDQKFSYIETSVRKLKNLLKSEKFIDIEWFQEREAREIIEYFGRNDPNEKVIMLYDDTQPKSKCQYLVRVYFDFTAFE